MAFELLVTKDVAYAAKRGGGVIANINEVTLLDCGAIAIFSVDTGKLVLPSTPSATIARHKEFRFVVNYGNNDQHLIWSQPFKEVDISAVPYKLAYEAPQKQRSFLGNDGAVGGLFLPLTLVPNTIGTVNIINTTVLRSAGLTYFSYDVKVKGGDTPTLYVARVVSTINADVRCPVTATIVGAGLGIRLDAKDFNESFEFSGSGILEDATKEELGVSNSLLMKVGAGTPDSLMEYEDKINGIRGFNNRLMAKNLWFSLPNIVDGGLTYDQYAFITDHMREVSSMRTHTQVKSLIVAIPVGATSQADFETILDLILPQQVLQV